MDLIHRALSGQTLTRNELRAAGIFILVWFVMDVIQFIDFVFDKFK